MGKFIRLETTKLPEDFNLEKDTEKPLVQILKERDRQIKIDYIFPGFYLYDADSEIDGRQFQKISIYCTGSISEFGKPFLPSFGRYIQIPRNSLVSKTLFERGIEFKFQGLSLWPAQRGRYDQKPNEYDYSSGFYKENTFYPGEDNIVRVNGPYEMDGYRAVLVHITPFQYNPAKEELIGYGSVTLTLDLIRDEKVAELPEAGRLMAFGNLIINPAIGIEKKLGFPVTKGKKGIIPSGPEFLVIYGKKTES
ncbi:MAG: C25 family peptidase propeptide domain-containing protein [Syntrophobacteraceae bacterium]